MIILGNGMRYGLRLFAEAVAGSLVCALLVLGYRLPQNPGGLSISSAFFAVFVMVSSISAVVGGIVIMNVMLVSVTERTKEIGVRRAVGATQTDVLRQFLMESVLQCILGGSIGVAIGFLCALALRELTSFPAAVEGWVAALGVVLSSVIGLFFGIYPATKAAKRMLIGRPRASGEMHETLLSKKLALPVFASDPLSSVAYATESALVVLVAASVTAAHLILVWEVRDDPNLLRHAQRAKEVGRNPKVVEYEPAFGPSASYYAWEAAGRPVHGVRRSA